MLRRHQREFMSLCQDMVTNRVVPKFVLLDVVTGGGKSPIPVIAATQLIPAGLIDAICWVVPRRSLQEQGEHAFGHPMFRQLLNHRMEARQSTNEINPVRDTAGYITTYQAVAEDAGRTNLAAFQQMRFALILDEPHHIEDGGTWHRAMQPLVDAATIVVMMTGTLERADGKRVALLPYRRVAGGWSPDIDDQQELRVIRYSRHDALRDHAIRRVEFRHLDGLTQFVGADGQVTFTGLSDAGKHARASLWTALNTEYARQLLDLAVEDWRQYRVDNPFSKLLVVAPSISAATEQLRWLGGAGVDRVGIATSQDSRDADEQIRRFKRSNRELEALDALVTVQMAYEGLDVPEITHIACLTHIRSRPWIEQMIGRGIRVVRDWGDWSSQFCIVFAPDDPLFNACAEAIRTDQAALVRDQVTTEGTSSGSAAISVVTPLYGQGTEERAAGLAPGEWLTPSETRFFRGLTKEYGVYGTPLAMRDMLRELGVDWAALVDEAPSIPPSSVFIPPSLREHAYREQIEQMCRRLDSAAGKPWGTTNAIVKRVFGKPREQMNEQELRAVLEWLTEQSRGLEAENDSGPYVAG